MIGQADWLAVVTDVIIASLAIVPSGELKASITTYNAKLRVVLERHTNAKGIVTTSITTVLNETMTELQVAKDLPGLGLAKRIAATYTCGFQLGRAVYDLDPNKAAAQLAECALELAPDMGEVKNAFLGNLTSLSYLKSLSEYAKLPAVINDFRQHGRQQVTWIVAKPEPPNWQKLVRDELGCLPDSGEAWDEFEIETARHDLTGDGIEELVKWSSCPTTTSSNAIWVLVYDGTSAADSQPKLIGKLGNHDYFKSMQIAFQGQASPCSAVPSDPTIRAAAPTNAEAYLPVGWWQVRRTKA